VVVDASSVSIDHDNLTNVTTSQHHVKTVASELNLADLAEKSHVSLTNVTASQHHTKYTDAEVDAIVAVHTTISTAHHTPPTSIADLATRDHDLTTGLTDDDHTIYALLVGRAGGQTIIGGTGSGDDLTLQSTSHATKGQIILSDQVLIDCDYPQIELKGSAGKAVTFLDNGSVRSRFMYYDSILDQVDLGDPAINMSLKCLAMNCFGIPFNAFKLGTGFSSGAGCLWFNSTDDMFEVRHNAGSRGHYLGSSFRMEVPTAIPVAPLFTGHAYFDPVLNTWNIWNGTAWRSIKM